MSARSDNATVRGTFDADWLASTPYAQDASLSAAQTLPSLPADATKAILQVTGANLRWRPDGVNPTASVGMLLKDGESVPLIGNLDQVKIIEVTGGATVNVLYFTDGS